MVSSHYKRLPMQVPWSLRLRRLARWGFLFPMGVLIPLLLWYLMGQTIGGDRFLGVVEAEAETVGAVGTVRILAIEVQPGQRVQPGDVLVRLDPAGPALDLAVQKARLLDLEQGTIRYRQALQESERRTRQIIREAAVAIEAARMNRIRDEAELSALRAELARLQPLVDQRLVRETELSSLRPRIAALEQIVNRYEPLMNTLQQRHDQALDDLRDVRELLDEADEADLVPAAEVFRQATLPLREGLGVEPTVLRASRAGVVSRIQYQAGDVVVGGAAIVRIAAEHSRYITGMLGLDQVQAVSVGDVVHVYRKTSPSRHPFQAVVDSMDPEIMDMLEPFNPAPRFPVRGRRIRLRVVGPATALIPGETVVLRFPSPAFRLGDLWPFGP